MRGTALLQRVSWIQVSLALHAALGFALWAAAPQWRHVPAADAHVYTVALFDCDRYGAQGDADAAPVEEEEETLCIERDEPDAQPGADDGLYDGPTDPAIWDSGEVAVEPEPEPGLAHDIHEVEPGEWAHTHVMVKYGFSGTCPHCKRPTSYSTRCTVPGCNARGGGGHRCMVSRCGSGRPATPKTPANAPAKTPAKPDAPATK